MIARIGSAFLMLLASSLPTAAQPFHHPFGEWREYSRDWLAACPDVIDESATDYYGFSCFASTGSQELNSANLPAYKLTIIRNRLTGDLDVAITIAADRVEARSRQAAGSGLWRREAPRVSTSPPISRPATTRSTNSSWSTRPGAMLCSNK
jgi:hypothetical protein